MITFCFDVIAQVKIMTSISVDKPFTVDEYELTYTRCPICREGIGKTIQTQTVDTHVYVRMSCRKHVFHLNCIKKWLNRRQCCPLCNYPEDGENITLHRNLEHRSQAIPLTNVFTINTNLTEYEYCLVIQEIRKHKEQQLDSNASYKKLLLVFANKSLVNKLSRNIFESLWSEIN